MIEEDEKRIRPTDHEADFVPFTKEGDKTDFIVDEEDSKMKLGEIEADINPVIAIPFTCTPQGDDVMAKMDLRELMEKTKTIKMIKIMNQ